MYPGPLKSPQLQGEATPQGRPDVAEVDLVTGSGPSQPGSRNPGLLVSLLSLSTPLDTLPPGQDGRGDASLTPLINLLQSLLTSSSLLKGILLKVL